MGIVKMKKNEKNNTACNKALEYGIDISLLDVNLKKTPTERIKNMNQVLNGIMTIKRAMKQNGN